MANPKPGSKRYKGPVHEAVRNALSRAGVQFGKPAGTKAKSLPSLLAGNRAAYAADKARLNAYKAKTRAPKNLIGETYDLFSGGNKTGVVAPSRAKAYSAKTNKLVQAKAAAKKKGNTKRVGRLTKRITRRERGDN